MALISPGVKVTITNESFYAEGNPGTVPLIVLASGENKINPATNDIAIGTRKELANTVRLITSQRDIVEEYGVPFFEKRPDSSAIHGSEVNEYGLLTAYNMLGVTNRVFVLRADIDLSQLQPSDTPETSAPTGLNWWLQTHTSVWGIQHWNGAPIEEGGQRFEYKIPAVYTHLDETRLETDVHVGLKPRASVGRHGDYSVVFNTQYNDAVVEAKIFYKSYGNGLTATTGQWYLVGSDDWIKNVPTVIPPGLFRPFDLNNNDFEITVTGRDGTDINIVFDSNSMSHIDANIFVNEVNQHTTALGVSVKFQDGKILWYADPELEKIVIEGSNDGFFHNLGFDFSGSREFYIPKLFMGPHTAVPDWERNGSTPRPTGSIWVNTTEPNNGARWRVKEWDQLSSSWIVKDVPLYDSTFTANWKLDPEESGMLIPKNTLFLQYNSEKEDEYDDTTTAIFKLWVRREVNETVVRSVPFEKSTNRYNLQYDIVATGRDNNTVNRATVTMNNYGIPGVTVSGEVMAEDFVIAATNAGVPYVDVEVINETEGPRVEFKHALGGDIKLIINDDGLSAPNDAEMFLSRFDSSAFCSKISNNVRILSNWSPLTLGDKINMSANLTKGKPEHNQLWYNPSIADIDFMVHNGIKWVGLNNHPKYGEDAKVIISVSEPDLTSTQRTQNNHIWVNTSDLENFPNISRWNNQLQRWLSVDVTDQFSSNGILFADARYGASGEDGDTESNISVMRNSDFVDFDAPDPTLYPRDMLLWNLRRSGGNVKQYIENYVNIHSDNPRVLVPTATGNSAESMFNYARNRWVTASPNTEQGVGTFFRKAQRATIVKALKAAIDSTEELRDKERRIFNIIACPGYTELYSNMVGLNIDRGISSFIVADPPMRLSNSSTELLSWGTNEKLALVDGDDGLVTYDTYSAIYYPNAYTNDLTGTGVVMPSSYMMLRTILLNDSNAYPWFAPAGIRRGGITNATAVGYIDASSGEFVSIGVTEGQRDMLYEMNINPITFFSGTGLVAYGQKTRAGAPSALDRINVSRLTIYIRNLLDRVVRPFAFEQNDDVTRNEAKQTVEGFLLELISQRALTDFIVVCDGSNNFRERINRNELWIDVAIMPVKAVEFIYVPLRVRHAEGA